MNTNNEIIYLKMIKYIDRGCPMQIIAFLEQSITFFGRNYGNNDLYVYKIKFEIKQAVQDTTLIMFDRANTEDRHCLFIKIIYWVVRKVRAD